MGRVPGDNFEPPVPIALAIQRTSEIFDDWFSRCYKLLHFIAGRILGSPEEAALAVQNCWLTASRNPRIFDCEGEFRSWLLRVLIDEALLILYHQARSQVAREYAHF